MCHIKKVWTRKELALIRDNCDLMKNSWGMTGWAGTAQGMHCDSHGGGRVSGVIQGCLQQWTSDLLLSQRTGENEGAKEILNIYGLFVFS